MEQKKKNSNKIIGWCLGIFGGVVLIFLIAGHVFNITFHFGTEKFGYILFPQSSQKLFPAFVGTNLLIEEARKTKDQDWTVKIKLIDFPKKHTPTDIARVEFRLLYNFCSSLPQLRTSHSIFNDLYNEEGKKVSGFTIRPSSCQEFLAPDYINKYYPDIFKEEVDNNIKETAPSLPTYMYNYLAIRKVSLNWENKNLTTEFTLYPQEPPVVFDYDKEQEIFLQASCQKVLDRLFNMNGHSYTLEYFNPQGDKLHTSNIPAYRCPTLR